jgi:DNA end-binding protein Ku
LYSATEDHDVHFHQFQRGTSSRIRYKRVNEDTGKEVDYDDIVKGAEIDHDKYVILTPEELEQVEPGRSRTIDITDFVDASKIDPIQYQKSYYLTPQDDTGEKAYSLLLKAMEKAGRIGIATFVMRSKQYLAAVRPHDKVLILETMFFADEVRDPAEEIEQLPAEQKLGKRDLDVAVSLIDAMTTDWDSSNYRDTYRERVEQLIEAKKNDEKVVVDQEPPAEGKVVDLLQALQASVDKAKGHKPGNTGRDAKVRTSKDTSKADGLDGLTKEELYDLAQELDVAGRSKMDRDELQKAVARAQKKRAS